MKNKKRIFLAGLMTIALVALSACHGGGGSTHLRWVNEADSNKVLEVTIQYPSALGRVHMAVMGGRFKGSYVLKDGEKTTEGRVTQLEDKYRLTSQDGKQQEFSVERTTGLLKDESGSTWKEDNPPKTTVTLKEW